MIVNRTRQDAPLQETLGGFWHLDFRLEVPDDHVLFLTHEGERIAIFSQTGATATSIRNECAKHLAARHCSPVRETDRSTISMN